jgi:hypothetical protein
MPYKSQAQAAYFNIHKKELEKEGVNVDEWNEASKGMDLPKHSQKHEFAGDYLKENHPPKAHKKK